MPYDEPADLIGSCEATLDTIALLLGDISEEVRDTPGTWNIAEILNHLLDAEGRYFARVRRLRRERQPQMKVMPDADVSRLSALQAWKLFYELRQRHLRLLRSLKPVEWRRSGTLTPLGGRAETLEQITWNGRTQSVEFLRKGSGFWQWFRGRLLPGAARGTFSGLAWR